jgi:aconitate decarboxylase
MHDPIRDFANFVVTSQYHDIPVSARAAAKIFILDGLGVGLAGSSGPFVAELMATQTMWGVGEDSRLWGSGMRLPNPAAAMGNAYQMHNSEFDCIHDQAVVHALSVVLPCAVSDAERRGSVNGHTLISAVILGVDVACNLGLAATSGMRFFRPGTAGLFGAVSAVGKIRGFDVDTLIRAYAIAYAQLSGTMQPHSEGSMLLGMQIGFNARNAIVACDMAEAGFPGLENILLGPYGYFSLFEETFDISTVLENLGRVWRIEEISHKPFPAGRATHGVAEAALLLRAAHDLNGADIEHVELAAPPMTNRLVGRPAHGAMDVNYGRLCAPYVAALALLSGRIDLSGFTHAALRDPATLALADKISMTVTDNPDPNILTPVVVTVTTRNKGVLRQEIETVLGHPDHPLSREAHLYKFRQNAAAALSPLHPDAAETLIKIVDNLESLDDVRRLADLLAPREDRDPGL